MQTASNEDNQAVIDEYSDEAKSLLQDKDVLMQALSTSHDTHVSMLDGKVRALCACVTAVCQPCVAGGPAR